MRTVISYVSQIPVIILVFVLTLTATVYSGYYVSNTVQMNLVSRFKEQVQNVKYEIEEQIHPYTEILYAQTSLLAMDKDLTRSEWYKFIDKMDVMERYPGIDGLGVAFRVTDESVGSFVETVKNDRSFNPNGYPNFQITPPGRRNHYMVNTFSYPYSVEEKVMGYDLRSEPNRYIALNKVINSGMIEATGPITLKNYDKDGPGFVLFHPFYHNNYQSIHDPDNVKGVVLAAFNVEKIIQSSHAGNLLNGINLRIYDQPTNFLYYDTSERYDAESSKNSIYSEKRTLEIAGRSWVLEFEMEPSFKTSYEKSLPYIVWAAGGVISVLIFFLFFSLGTSRRKALKMADELTEQSELARLQQQSVMASIGEGLIVVDKQGMLTYLNPEGERILGWSFSEINGKEIHPIIHYNYKEDQPCSSNTQCELINVVNSGSIYREEDDVFIQKDGSKISVSVVSSPIIKEDKVAGAVIVFQDISARKEAERELQIAANVFNNTTDSIVVTDHKGVIISVNAAFETMTGYSSAEAIGKKPSILKSNIHDRPFYLKLWNDLLKAGLWKGEIWNRRKNGDIFVEFKSISAITDDKNNIVQFVAIAKDITEMKKIELELEKSRDEALAASKTKSEFLAMMSHEIRTPMNSIIGMSDLLSETNLSSEQREYVQVFRNSGENLLHLINDILDLSKAESGKMTVEEIPFDLVTTIEQIRDIFMMKTKQKGLDLKLQIDENLSRNVIGDPKRLDQVLTNFIANAIKFTESGFVLITIKRCDQVNANDDTEIVQFSVEDSGIGIPEEKLELIFESFTQVDTSITRKYGGTGLGLSIAKQLIELMGGTIQTKSEVGKGSVFTFTIPFKKVLTRDKNVIHSTDHSMPHLIYEGPKRILLVEDVEENRLLIKAYLSKTPFELDLAENGFEAIERVKQFHYDLILMDMQMPIMDGYTATRKIRELEINRGESRVPIIALTAYGLDEEVAKSMISGCDLHLTKPIKKNVLLQSIQMFFDNY